MKCALRCSALALLVALSACGKREEPDPPGASGSLKLPILGECRVTDGTLTVEKADQDVLAGRVVLILAGPEGTRSASGTFKVRGNTLG